MDREEILQREWSPRNDKPFSEYPHSSKYKAWWLCNKSQCEHPHEWQTSICHRRFTMTNCPFCCNQKLCVCNSLATLRPELASQWHSSKNEGLRPEAFAIFSNKRVWWLCDKSKCDHPHEWQTTINNRTKGMGCPYCYGRVVCLCNSLEKLKPELASQWHPSKNEGLTPSMFSVCSNKKVWWLCDKYYCDHPHEWQAIINDRTGKGKGCPYCSGRVVCPCNSLARIMPEIAKEWHPTKNGELEPHMFSVSSGMKAWWSCFRKHEWKAHIYTRTNEIGCPVCKTSKGEKAVQKILDKQGVKYDSQYTIFPEGASRLYFDFYLPKYNVAIEFDGIQHFEPVEFFGGEDRFKYSQYLDSCKDAYCAENGINLLRIHYLDMEEINLLVDFVLVKSTFNYILFSSSYPYDKY